MTITTTSTPVSSAPANSTPTKLPPYKLASRAHQPESTVITVGTHRIGDGSVTLIAGPCSVEGESEIIEIAHQLKQAGAHLLRGGAFKPRSSPYSFQGLGETGLKYLALAKEATGLPIVSEVMDIENLPMACDYIDVIQIGARNMQNYPLLKAVGQTTKPVLLKRGLSATIEEWLMAAEYVLSEGNPNVILCERGIRTFETATRNTLDLNAVPVVKHLSHLPIIADPSHGTGVARYVAPMSMAAVAAGADGLILEAHQTPESAWSDGQQSITPEEFSGVANRVRAFTVAMQPGRIQAVSHQKESVQQVSIPTGSGTANQAGSLEARALQREGVTVG